jgi:hypothetical protein
MSHTATINAIKIQSISALRDAVSELNASGIKCSLLEKATPRAYYPNQTGMGLAPYVVQLSDCQYDIGLYEDGKGGYEARTDFFMGYVQKHLGVEACSIESRDQAKLGKLFQAYGICAATESARKQGHMVRRVANDDGSVKLVVTGTGL